MNNNRLKIFLLLVMLVGIAKAQNKNGELIFKAMQDELDRSMKELKSPDNVRPFFLEYEISEGQMLRYTATLGSLTDQMEYPKTSGINVRMLIGNYHRTNTMQYPLMRFPSAIASVNTTLEEDYGQLRRDLWRQTDLQFKSATEEYNKKLNLVKQGRFSPEDTLMDDLAKVKPTLHVDVKGFPVFDKEKIKKITAELSAVFNDYPMIEQSDVQLMASTNMLYFLNSEKSKYTIPSSSIQFSINVSTKTEKRQISDNLKIAALTEQDLASSDLLKAQVKAFADQFVKLIHCQDIAEEYSGPVLFEGDAAFDLFFNDLFAYNAAYASRENGTNPVSASLQDKMNSRVMDNQFTVKCLPFLKEFNNQRLIGHFEMDSEGVVPEKELILIENGMLKNVISNRMPAKYNPSSSGYFRPGYLMSLYIPAMCPGVVEISTSKGTPVDSLKQKLIRSARENGLKYGYIIRRAAVSSVMGPSGGQLLMTPANIYRVNVENGEEMLVRGGELKSLKKGFLKSVSGASDQKHVRNELVGMSIPVSMICPSAVLLPDVEISLKKELPLAPRYVENPLLVKN